MIFITGGTGNTGLKLAKLLDAANQPILLASRSGTAPEPFTSRTVKFDWFDPSTFQNPYIKASELNETIDRIYLVSPVAIDPTPHVKPFVDLAISKGAKRFVLCSATGIGKGDPLYGKVHEIIVDSGLDYTVLRPTYFMENFFNMFGESIRKSNETSSCTEDGRIPFIACQDIAQAAYEAITAEKSSNSTYYVLGSEFYTYDEADAILSKVLGRTITHKKLTRDEKKLIFQGWGVPEESASFFLDDEVNVAKGSLEEYAKVEGTYFGKTDLEDFFKENKEIWKV